MKITLVELLAFVTIADTGSMTKAAEQLLMSTPMVSRVLRRLESKLEIRLIGRTTRKLKLTEEGISFLDQARSIIESVELVEQQIALRRGTSIGILRVNSTASFMQHLIVPVMARFRAAHPGTQIELSTSDDIVELLEYRADVVIRVDRPESSALCVRRLGSSRLRVLASPGYLKEHGEPQRTPDLSFHTLLGCSRPEVLNRWPLSHSRGNSFDVTPALRASNSGTLLALGVNGAGIVCLADYMTNAFRCRGELVEILAHDTVDCFQEIHGVYLGNTRVPLLIANFLNIVRAQLGHGDGINEKDRAEWNQPVAAPGPMSVPPSYML